MRNPWVRESRRDKSNHVVGNPTNAKVGRLTDQALADYESALNRQIEKGGSLNAEREAALKIARERLEKTKAERGF